MNATSPRIDTHQHFWAINDTDYVWMTGAHATIKRDFLPADLRPLLDESGIGGCVAVQARQMVSETEWLLKLIVKRWEKSTRSLKR
jgi:L-fuconolactonase